MINRHDLRYQLSMLALNPQKRYTDSEAATLWAFAQGREACLKPCSAGAPLDDSLQAARPDQWTAVSIP